MTTLRRQLQVKGGFIGIGKKTGRVTIAITQMHLPGCPRPVNPGNLANITRATGSLTYIRAAMQQQKTIQFLGIRQASLRIMAKTKHQAAMNPTKASQPGSVKYPVKQAKAPSIELFAHWQSLLCL
jgi:hypothetical protein